MQHRMFQNYSLFDYEHSIVTNKHISSEMKHEMQFEVLQVSRIRYVM